MIGCTIRLTSADWGDACIWSRPRCGYGIGADLLLDDVGGSISTTLLSPRATLQARHFHSVNGASDSSLRVRRVPAG